VFYGNIGSDERLDFTVAGPAVNEVARIAAMCRSVERNVLLSGVRRRHGEIGAWSAGLGRPLCMARRRAAARAVHLGSVLDCVSGC
jgi:class 3 adenylate cyclase